MIPGDGLHTGNSKSASVYGYNHSINSNGHSNSQINSSSLILSGRERASLFLSKLCPSGNVNLFNTIPAYQELVSYATGISYPAHQVIHTTGPIIPIQYNSINANQTLLQQQQRNKRYANDDEDENETIRMIKVNKNTIPITADSSPRNHSSISNSSRKSNDEASQQDSQDRIDQTIQHLASQKVKRAVRKVCDRCCSSKARCVRLNTNGPCQRCIRLSEPCTFSEQRKRGRGYKFNFDPNDDSSGNDDNPNHHIQLSN